MSTDISGVLGSATACVTAVWARIMYGIGKTAPWSTTSLVIELLKSTQNGIDLLVACFELVTHHSSATEMRLHAHAL